MGITKGFSDKYLEVFGEMFSTDKLATTEEKIASGRKFIEQIKRQNLGETRTVKDFMLTQSEDVQVALNDVLDRLKAAGLDICTGDIIAIQEIFEEEQEKFRQKKLEEFFSGKNILPEQGDEIIRRIEQKAEDGIDLDDMEEEVADELNTIGAEASKISNFGAKMLELRGKVIDEITTKVKDYFINDLIQTSQGSDMPQLSSSGWDVYFRIKDLNYGEIVKYTNWDFQTEEFPQAVLEMAQKCAESLVKSGAIRNKFYDSGVRAYVTDEDAKKHMRTQFRPEDAYTSYRREHGIGDLKATVTPSSSKYTGTAEQHETMELMSLFGDLYRYAQNRNETFASMYEDTYRAVETRIRKKVQTALSEEHKVDEKHLYSEKLQEQIDAIRQEIIAAYGTTNLNKEQQEAFIGTKTALERKNMEQKMALQLFSKFIAQTTDRSFEDIAKATGYLPKDLREHGNRGTIVSNTVVGLMKQHAEALREVLGNGQKVENNGEEKNTITQVTQETPAGAYDGR